MLQASSLFLSMRKQPPGRYQSSERYQPNCINNHRAFVVMKEKGSLGLVDKAGSAHHAFDVG